MAIAARVETQTPVRPTEAWAVPRRRGSGDAQQRPSEPTHDDYFSTMMPWAMLIVTALPFVALFLWLVLAYFGVEYGTPTVEHASRPASATLLTANFHLLNRRPAVESVSSMTRGDWRPRVPNVLGVSMEREEVCEFRRDFLRSWRWSSFWFL